MGYCKDRNIEPVCRFGPGGDFTTVWPKDAIQSTLPGPNSLTKVLNKIAFILNSAISSESISGSKPTTSIHQTSDNNTSGEGNLIHADKERKSDEPVNAEANRTAKGNIKFPGQQLLFADDSRAGKSVRHKPKHRIRAHHRAAKKGTAFAVAGQGSLFDDNFKSAKTA